MAVKSVIENFSYGQYDKMTNGLNACKTAMKEAADSVSNRAATFWECGFIGMSEAQISNFKYEFNKYIISVQDIIDNFDANAQVDTAIKGTQIEPAVHTYLDSIKVLLKKYVDVLRQEMSELDEAYKNFVTTTQSSISGDIENIASDIEGKAKSISLD